VATTRAMNPSTLIVKGKPLCVSHSDVQGCFQIASEKGQAVMQIT